MEVLMVRWGSQEEDGEAIVRVPRLDSLLSCVAFEEQLVGLREMWFASDEYGVDLLDVRDR